MTTENFLAPLTVLVAMVAVAAYVGWPLRGAAARRTVGASVAGDTHLRALAEERRSILVALREIDRDRDLGNLSDDDHSALRESYERRALALYPALDAAVQAHVEALAPMVARARANLIAADHTAGSSRQTDATTVVALPGRSSADVNGAAPPRPTAARPAARAPIGVIVAALVASIGLGALGALWYIQSSPGVAVPIATVRAPDYHVIAVDPADPARLYLGTHAGLFVSRDGGVGWTGARDLPLDVMGVVRTSRGLLAAGHDVFYLGGADGEAWRAIASGLPGTDVHALAVSPTDPARLYAAVVDHGLFRSDDGGASWTGGGRMPPSLVSLATVPQGTSELLYGATLQEGVVASTDGGRSWASANGFVNGALPTRAVRAIVFDGRSGDTAAAVGSSFRGALFVATDRGVYRSTDGGSSWNRLGLEGDIAALALGPDPRVLFAIDNGGRVYRSANRGLTWDGRS